MSSLTNQWKYSTHNLYLLLLSICIVCPIQVNAEDGSSLSATTSNQTPASQLTDNSDLEREYSANKDDPEIKFKLARSYSFAGYNQKAIYLLKELVNKYPDNPDYLLALGQAYLWNNDAKEAIYYLEKAAVIAPQYQDVQDALAKARSKVEEKPVEKFSINLENHYEILSYNNDDWYDGKISITRHLANDNKFSLSYQHSRRFGLPDNAVGISGYKSLSKNLGTTLEFNYSPNANFLPEFYTYVNIEYKLPADWVLMGGVNFRDYNANGNVYISNITVEKYISDYRFAYTPYFSHSDAGNALSHRFDVSYYWKNNSLNLSVATGKEIEKTLNAFNLTETRFNNISIWCRNQLNTSLFLYYGFGFNDLEINNKDGNRKAANLNIEYFF